MRVITLPFDPEGGYGFDDEWGLWRPERCPLCNLGDLIEEPLPDGGWKYTCWNASGNTCHMQFYVAPGIPYGSFAASIAYLRNLGVLPPPAKE